MSRFSLWDIAVHRVLFFLVAFVAIPAAVYAKPDAASTASGLLPLTPDAARQLDHAQKFGAIEFAPVHLPTDSAGDCNHLGWPIATMTNVNSSLLPISRAIS